MSRIVDTAKLLAFAEQTVIESAVEEYPVEDRQLSVLQSIAYSLLVIANELYWKLEGYEVEWAVLNFRAQLRRAGVKV